MQFSYRFIFILLIFLNPGLAFSQLCQGSLGDPIVNKTFGAGANPGAPLAAATTNYQYLPTDCPNDGYYTIRSNTSSCFDNSWHNLVADHTGDAGGYFMLVNASISPGVFYADTVRGLCPNSTYEFALWILNIMKPSACNGNGIKPNLTFNIEKKDGALLQSFSTGDIPSQPGPAWQQVGFFFTTDAGTNDVVLRIVNNSPGGCGNDLVLDDITFRACGPKLGSSITGNPLTDIIFCEGVDSSFVLNGTISAGFSNPSFQWQEAINDGDWKDIPGATTTTYSKHFPANSMPAVYKYRLSAAESGNMSSLYCRVASPELMITIAGKPHANAGPDKTTLAGISTQLSGSLIGYDLGFSWSPLTGMTNPQSLEPTVTPLIDGNYVLTAISNIGCGISTDTAHVFVYADIFIPKAFTPNGDGLNDSWHISTLDAITKFRIIVYNRWGQEVFQTKNINRSWDGKFKGQIQPAGGYVYLVELEETHRVLKGVVFIIK